MKHTTIISLLFLFSNISFCQEIKTYESQNSEVFVEKEINPKKIFIGLMDNAKDSFKSYVLSSKNDENIKIDGAFPTEEGYYGLLITYENLIYREIVWYRKDILNEKLIFHFYKSQNKIFCKITSKECLEINKEIILYEWNQAERKKMFDEIKRKK